MLVQRQRVEEAPGVSMFLRNTQDPLVLVLVAYMPTAPAAQGSVDERP